jgi:hypothetical protein
MAEELPWLRANEMRDQLPADVAAVIDAMRRVLPVDADVYSTITALASRGLAIFHCNIGVRALLDIDVGEAKRAVHRHPAFAADSEDRERFWAELHEGILAATARGELPGAVQQPTPPNRPTRTVGTASELRIRSRRTSLRESVDLPVDRDI